MSDSSRRGEREGKFGNQTIEHASASNLLTEYSRTGLGSSRTRSIPSRRGDRGNAGPRRLSPEDKQKKEFEDAIDALKKLLDTKDAPAIWCPASHLKTMQEYSRAAIDDTPANGWSNNANVGVVVRELILYDQQLEHMTAYKKDLTTKADILNKKLRGLGRSVGEALFVHGRFLVQVSEARKTSWEKDMEQWEEYKKKHQSPFKMLLEHPGHFDPAMENVMIYPFRKAKPLV
jgi:hypothetical protein